MLRGRHSGPTVTVPEWPIQFRWLKHLGRTDLKADGFQASNVVRIPSRNADSLIVAGFAILKLQRSSIGWRLRLDLKAEVKNMKIHIFQKADGKDEKGVKGGTTLLRYPSFTLVTNFCCSPLRRSALPLWRLPLEFLGSMSRPGFLKFDTGIVYIDRCPLHNHA